MGLSTVSIRDAMVSHAMATGVFARVNQHELVSDPGTGVACSVFLDRVEPVRSSGLGSVSVMVVFTVRLYLQFNVQPTDDVDGDLLAAVDTLMTAYTGDFTLGTLVRNVDIFGANGVSLAATMGYASTDGSTSRIADISVPIIINDAWNQAA